MLLNYDTTVLPRVRMMGRVRYHEPWCHFSRVIDEYILYVIRDGDMYLEENGVRMHLKAGDFLLLEPNLPHAGYKAASCDYYYAHFKHDRMSRALDDEQAVESMKETRRKSMIGYNLDEIDPTDPVIGIPKRFNVFALEYRQMLHAAVEAYDRREEQYKRYVSTQLHLFLMMVAHEFLTAECAKEDTKRKKSEVAVDSLIRYLNAHYTENITSDQISERFEMNFDYLNRVFSSVTGSTIFYYINMLRISNAKQLITTTNLTFAEVAYLVGVEDRYYFTRLFKRYVGMTPTDYYRAAHTLPPKEGETV
jgi:YesN/AraC family two-component response regulator